MKQFSEIPLSNPDQVFDYSKYQRNEISGDPFVGLKSTKEKFGDIYRTKVLVGDETSQKIVEKLYVHDHKALNEILLDKSGSWKKGPTIAEAVASLVPLHPVALDGEIHSKLRLAFQQGANSQITKRFPKIVEKHARKLHAKLQEFAENQTSINNMDEFTRAFATDTLAEAVLGGSWGAIDDFSSENKLVWGLESIMKELHWRVSESFDQSWKKNPTRGDIGTLIAPIAAAYGNLYSGTLTEMKELNDEERKTRDKSESKTILDHWILNGVLKEKLDENEVLNLCLSFLSMGHENTGSIAAWMILKLAENPQLQEGLRKEADAVPESHFIDGFSLKEINSMFPNFVKAYEETLRLYSSFPIITRESTKAIEVLGFEIPQGTEVMIPLYELHRQTGIWGADGEEFNPKRFEAASCPHVSINGFPDAQPFSSGDNSCSGRTMALLMTHAIVISVLKSFRIVSQLPEPVQGNQFISFRPGKHEVKLEKIQKEKSSFCAHQ